MDNLLNVPKMLQRSIKVQWAQRIRVWLYTVGGVICLVIRAARERVAVSPHLILDGSNRACNF